ncbi:probable ATP-dependent DNA helicase HFM1 [Bombina bombina]|uniref:probable ATP-dependent DNA helicase HFM1 n=1 Tax=Bombina bombina TaxID=8345 RepID=UPI00235AB356|nr:probable ATP-dependent DNA helicase HFM1 [Bombina bombina]
MTNVFDMKVQMQMINEANKNMNLQKYVFTPKTSKTSCTWSPYLQSPPQTLKLPNSTDIMRHYNEHAQDGANFKSSDNLGSKKSQTATSKKTTINSSLTNLTDADKSSCCSTKNLEVTFELGTVWDNFDDDILLDASSFTMETSALGSKNLSFSEFHSTPAFSPSAEQKEQAWSNSVSSKVWVLFLLGL